MIMRLLDRDPRADSSTVSAWLPTRTTHASNFSLERRWACSAVIGTASIPNWRKHSESMVLEDSCRSTNAARAENFLEEVRGVREFPKAISLNGMPATNVLSGTRIVRHAWRRDASRRAERTQQFRRNTILARDSVHSNRELGQYSVPRCYYQR